MTLTCNTDNVICHTQKHDTWHFFQKLKKNSNKLNKKKHRLTRDMSLTVLVNFVWKKHN